MSRWRARSTAPEGGPILVRYMDKWRGENFRETFEAEFDGNTCWRRNYMPRDYDKPYNLRTQNGDTQKRVYENGIRCAIVGWRHLPSNVEHQGPTAALSRAVPLDGPVGPHGK